MPSGRHGVRLARLAMLAVVLTIPAAAPAGAQEPASTPGFVDLDMMSVRSGGGLYAANRDGVLTEIGFPLDLRRLDPERGHDSWRLGDTGEAVVMLDRYAVRGEGAPTCPDGYDAFLRVFSLALRREVFVRPIAGCADGERAALEDRATWIAPDGFRIEGGTPENFKIAADGRSVRAQGETE